MVYPTLKVTGLSLKWELYGYHNEIAVSGKTPTVPLRDSFMAKKRETYKSRRLHRLLWGRDVGLLMGDKDRVSLPFQPFQTLVAHWPSSIARN